MNSIDRLEASSSLLMPFTRRECLSSLSGMVLTATALRGQDKTPAQPVSAKAATIAPAVWQETRTTSQRLVQQSQASFVSGLMPLVDHLEHLSVATGLNLKLAGAAQQRDAQRDWNNRHVRQLEAVVTQLQRFQQPASAGWEADVLLARYSHADAQARLAKFENRPELAASLQSQAAEFARQHWVKRLDDSSIGHSSAMQVWRAASLLSSTDGRSATTDRRFLLQAIDATDRWNFLGAGIGRNDLREAFQYELARVDLQDSKPGSAAFSQKAQQAEAHLVHLHETTLQFHANGTTGLHDVAATWRERAELHAFLQSSGENAVSNSWKQRRESDLRSLEKLAQRTTDVRGRNGADVTYVAVLSLSEQTSNVR